MRGVSEERAGQREKNVRWGPVARDRVAVRGFKLCFVVERRRGSLLHLVRHRRLLVPLRPFDETVINRLLLGAHRPARLRARERRR